MVATTVTESLDFALKAEQVGRFAEAREWLRQPIALDGGPATLDARLRLGRRLIESGEQVDHVEAEREISAARAQAEQTGTTRSAAAAIHLLTPRERFRNDRSLSRTLLAESPVAGDVASPNPARAQWLHYNGLLQGDTGDLNAAERFFFRAYQVYQECHFQPGLAEVCDSLANLLIRSGNAAYALTFAR